MELSGLPLVCLGFLFEYLGPNLGLLWPSIFSLMDKEQRLDFQEWGSRKGTTANHQKSLSQPPDFGHVSPLSLVLGVEFCG